MNVPYLAVFSAPRSGSNHFFDLLAAREGMVSLNEFFGKQPQGLTKELSAASLKPYGDFESFAAVAKNHPVETLRFLENVPGARIAAIKIQPRHLGIPHPVTEFMAASAGNIFCEEILSLCGFREERLKNPNLGETSTPRSFLFPLTRKRSARTLSLP